MRADMTSEDTLELRDTQPFRQPPSTQNPDARASLSKRCVTLDCGTDDEELRNVAVLGYN